MNIVVKTTLQFKAKKIYIFGYYYEENSPEEIKNSAVEMDGRLNDPIVAQMIYVKKLAKYSTKFLRDNQNWIQ